MSISTGDIFENIADHPGRIVRVVDVLPDGHADTGGPLVHVEVVAAPSNVITRYGTGSTMFTTPRALLNLRRYHRLGGA